MIDYDKLKVAVAILKSSNERLQIEYKVGMDSCYNKFEYFNLTSHDLKINFMRLSLDKLIENLKQLTKPEPRYKIGDQAWYMMVDDGRDFDLATITNVAHNGSRYDYTTDCGDNDYWICESDLYPSREALIEAQLKYWQSLANSDDSSINSEDSSPNNATASCCSTHAGDHEECNEPVTERNLIECDHHYTLTSGLACAACGKNVVIDGGADGS